MLAFSNNKAAGAAAQAAALWSAGALAKDQCRQRGQCLLAAVLAKSHHKGAVLLQKLQVDGVKGRAARHWVLKGHGIGQQHDACHANMCLAMLLPKVGLLCCQLPLPTVTAIPCCSLLGCHMTFCCSAVLQTETQICQGQG